MMKKTLPFKAASFFVRITKGAEEGERGHCEYSQKRKSEWEELREALQDSCQKRLRTNGKCRLKRTVLQKI